MLAPSAEPMIASAHAGECLTFCNAPLLECRTCCFLDHTTAQHKHARVRSRQHMNYSGDIFSMRVCVFENTLCWPQWVPFVGLGPVCVVQQRLACLTGCVDMAAHQHSDTGSCRCRQPASTARHGDFCGYCCGADVLVAWLAFSCLMPSVACWEAISLTFFFMGHGKGC